MESAYGAYVYPQSDTCPFFVYAIRCSINQLEAGVRLWQIKNKNIPESKNY
jgi:hypothetical protein